MAGRSWKLERGLQGKIKGYMGFSIECDTADSYQSNMDIPHRKTGFHDTLLELKKWLIFATSHIAPKCSIGAPNSSNLGW